MKLSLPRSLIATLALGALSPLAVHAQEEGALRTYISKEPNDTQGALALLQQNVNKLQVDTTLELFLLQYGGRIHAERIAFPASTPDHEIVPAYLFRPANLPAGEKRPGIVDVHGALHESLDWRDFPFIVDCIDRGYVVIFPEYRGSVGYGEVNYINSYGVTDVADILAAADYFAKQPYVDAAHIGIFGHSRGGFITVSAIERAPKRFQAAVEVSALLDFLAYMTYKPAERQLTIAKEAEFGGKLPSQNLVPYLDITPLNHVDRIQTPILGMATTGDKILPTILNTQRFLELLKAHDKVFDGHIYTLAPGGHNFIFGDSPDARDCFRRTFDWFDRYLKVK